MKFLLLILLSIQLSSCCNYSDSDFQFSKQHISLYRNYRLNDTIYFATKNNEIDTVYIVTIDSFQQCGGLMGFPRKNVAIEIQHLPKNIWTGGTEMYQDKPPKTLNQELIVIEKIPSQNPEEQYFIGINYRDFSGELKNLDEIHSDNLFHELGINNYWEINTNIPKDKQDSTCVTKVYWTDKYGLTGYYKKNGEYYLRKN